MAKLAERTSFTKDVQGRYLCNNVETKQKKHPLAAPRTRSDQARSHFRSTTSQAVSTMSHSHDRGVVVRINSAITCCLLWSGLTFAYAQPVARSTSEGVFTEEQAQRGATAYNKNCAGCHGSALRSTDREVPNLTGDLFKRWVGRTLGEEFEVMRDTMPPRDERSLPDEVYLDILVFILRANKVPVGSHELKPEPETLKQITISEPG